MNDFCKVVSDKLTKISLTSVAGFRCCKSARLLSILLFILLILPQPGLSPALWAESKLNVTENLRTTQSIKSLWQQKRAKRYNAYSSKQLQLAESVFEQLLLNRLTEKILKQLRSLNLSLTKVDNYFLISEALPPYAGQGLYVIRVKGGGDILLQAPHSFHDLKTGNIAIKMMRENSIRALAINTVSRRYTTSEGRKYNADMAHLAESLFVAISRAFANVYSDGKIVQLHGFNAAKRAQKRQREPRLEIIISNGTRAVSQRLILQKACLDKVFSIHSHVYPLDINELGGTTNSIGRAVRQMGFSYFEHIEMSLPVRQKLNRSEEMRRGLFECISK